jgi:hypothetical protein
MPFADTPASCIGKFGCKKRIIGYGCKAQQYRQYVVYKVYNLILINMGI